MIAVMMNRNDLPALPVYCRALLLCAATAVSLPALAVDGTITINGEIIDSTCKINGQTPPADLLVTLPKISRSALKTKGATAGATVFVLALTECPSSLADGKVRAYFEPGRTTDYATGNLIAYQTSSAVTTTKTTIPEAPGTAMNNVQIQLANPDGTTIRMGDDVAAQGGQGETLQTSGTYKSATLRYLARYVRTGDGEADAGKLVTYVQYSIVYP